MGSTFELITNKLIFVKNYGFIFLTDIADFFLRIYLHNIEHVLDRASNKKNHFKSLMIIIKPSEYLIFT